MKTIERKHTFVATMGRRPLSVVVVDPLQADCLLRLFEQSREERLDSYRKLNNLMKELPKLEARGEKVEAVRFNYVTPAGIHERLPVSLHLRVARFYLICGGIEIMNQTEEGIENLKKDLRSFIVGLNTKDVSHPFLITEGFKPKNGPVR